MPEWPFGYRPVEENRLMHRDLLQLALDATWDGHDSSGAPFAMVFDKDGRVALRTRASLLVGTAEIRDGMLCVRIPGALLGREDCGRVYLNPEGTPANLDEYVRVSLGDVYRFSPAR